MHPILFELGDWPVYSYGVLLAAAYLLGLQLAVWRAKRRGVDPNRVMDLGIWIIIAALVGAKALLVIVDFDYYRSNPREIFSLVRSAGVFYGGLVLATVTGILLVRRYQLPLWTTADLYAPGVALGHVIGRLGCFLAGCCWGKPTDVAWAVTFTNPAAAINVGTPLNIPLHPTQLYEAGAELVILALLLLTERKGRYFAGRTFWLYMLTYGITRFVIEMFRDDPRGLMMGMSTSQFVSVLLVPISLAMLYWLSRRPQSPTPGAQARAAA
ncbi:MAG: prolipoprotein diacylglyceryl transferase [Acidobacteriota bacterium]|nr:prolipoprotein diacylglyceryl transferase [Acidobacteriota bacterium]